MLWLVVLMGTPTALWPSSYGHTSSWGPSGGIGLTVIGLIILILLILLLIGRS